MGQELPILTDTTQFVAEFARRFVAGQQAVSPELREHLDALEVEGACRAGFAHHGYGDAGGFIFADSRASAPERDVLARDGNHGINERFYGHAVHLGIPSLLLEV